MNTISRISAYQMQLCRRGRADLSVASNSLFGEQQTLLVQRGSSLTTPR